MLTYTQNAAEMHSLLSGYGTLTLTKPDGEPISLRSQNADAAFSPVTNASPIQDYEMVLENGVEIGMDYNTVLSLIGTPDKVWSDAMAGMGMASEGVSYSFLYDDRLSRVFGASSFASRRIPSSRRPPRFRRRGRLRLAIACSLFLRKYLPLTRYSKSGRCSKSTAGMTRRAARRHFSLSRTAFMRSIL